MSKRTPNSWRIPYEPPKPPFERQGAYRLLELLFVTIVGTIMIAITLALV